MKKLIRYRISISKVFPAYHPRKGEPTGFRNSIMQACTASAFGSKRVENKSFPSDLLKIHTIRGNYDLWAKRFEKINKGEAVLELYEWTGKPYNSKCEVIETLDRNDGIGVEKLKFESMMMTVAEVIRTRNGDIYRVIKPKTGIMESISKNDGLSLEDFKEWFKPYDLSEPMAIIHFTRFRYEHR